MAKCFKDASKTDEKIIHTDLPSNGEVLVTDDLSHTERLFCNEKISENNRSE